MCDPRFGCWQVMTGVALLSRRQLVRSAQPVSFWVETKVHFRPVEDAVLQQCVRACVYAGLAASLPVGCICWGALRALCMGWARQLAVLPSE